MLKTSDLCLASATRNGKVENRLAETAPKPMVTNKIGKAQQTRVADDVNNTNQPQRFRSIKECASVMIVFCVVVFNIKVFAVFECWRGINGFTVLGTS